MKIMAFDLATVTGVAIGDSHSIPLCHTERLGQVGAPHGARLSEALYMTSRLIKQHQPDAIAIEAPVIAGVKGGQDRALLAIGLRSAVVMMAHMRGVRCVEYSVASIRKHFIGVGRLKRTEAKRRTMQRCKLLGWHVANDNEADAAAVWEFARLKLTNTFTPPPAGLFEVENGRAAVHRSGADDSRRSAAEKRSS